MALLTSLIQPAINHWGLGLHTVRESFSLGGRYCRPRGLGFAEIRRKLGMGPHRPRVVLAIHALAN